MHKRGSNQLRSYCSSDQSKKGESMFSFLLVVEWKLKRTAPVCSVNEWYVSNFYFIEHEIELMHCLVSLSLARSSINTFHIWSVCDSQLAHETSTFYHRTIASESTMVVLSEATIFQLWVIGKMFMMGGGCWWYLGVMVVVMVVLYTNFTVHTT